MFYTMIGSRSTPYDIIKLGEQIALLMESKGYIVRSGGAMGMDSSAEVVKPNMMDIYLPWCYYNSKHGEGYHYKLKKFDEAFRIASEVHPAWNRCSDGARKLHSRNVYQVLGSNLNSPSKFLVCWAEPIDDKGCVKGGTATAVKIAIENNIPVYNLWYDDVAVGIIEILNKNY